MNLHDEAERGRKAKEFISSPVYKEAWANYERILLDLLANADTPKGKAEEVRALLIAARKAKGQLERIMQDGKIAEEQIREEERRRSLKQRLRAAF